MSAALFTYANTDLKWKKWLINLAQTLNMSIVFNVNWTFCSQGYWFLPAPLGVFVSNLNLYPVLLLMLKKLFLIQVKGMNVLSVHCDPVRQGRKKGRKEEFSLLAADSWAFFCGYQSKYCDCWNNSLYSVKIPSSSHLCLAGKTWTALPSSGEFQPWLNTQSHSNSAILKAIILKF